MRPHRVKFNPWMFIYGLAMILDGFVCAITFGTFMCDSSMKFICWLRKRELREQIQRLRN